MPNRAASNHSEPGIIYLFPWVLLVLYVAVSLPVLWLKGEQSYEDFLSFSGYFVFPACFTAMLFMLIFFAAPQVGQIWKTTFPLVSLQTVYVYLFSWQTLYRLAFLPDIWWLSVLLLLVYALYILFRSKAYWSAINIPLVLATPFIVVLIAFISWGCGTRYDWIAWTPFWQVVITGPCI